MAISLQVSGDRPNIQVSDQELDNIVANNLEDDVIGVQKDILDLMNSRNPGGFDIDVYVFSANPLRIRVSVGNTE